MRPIFQGIVRGATGQYERGCYSEIHAFGDRDEYFGVGHHSLGKATPASKSDDFIACSDVMYPFTNLFDDTCYFASWREGHSWLELIFALDDQGIRKINAAGFYRDNDLPLASFGRFDLFYAQAFGWAILFPQDCFHEVLLLEN